MMTDEQIGQFELLLQTFQQVQNLRLHRDIKRRGRFVHHDKFGMRGNRPRHRNPLALPAGKFVRIAQQMILAQADGLQQRDHASVHFARAHPLIQRHRLGDDMLDQHARVER